MQNLLFFSFSIIATTTYNRPIYRRGIFYETDCINNLYKIHRPLQINSEKEPYNYTPDCVFPVNDLTRKTVLNVSNYEQLNWMKPNCAICLALANHNIEKKNW